MAWSFSKAFVFAPEFGRRSGNVGGNPSLDGWYLDPSQGTPQTRIYDGKLWLIDHSRAGTPGRQQPARCMSFASQSAVVPADAAFSFGDGVTDAPFSAAAWIRSTSIGDIQGVCGKDVGSNREWGLILINLQLRLFLKDGSTGNQQSVDSTTLLEADTWYHVVATYDGRGGDAATDGIQLFIDGVSETTTDAVNQTPYTAMDDKGADFRYGIYSTWPFTGQLADVGLFGRVLSQGEIDSLIDPLAPTYTNAVAFYPCDYSAGTVAIDASGNGHDGTHDATHDTTTAKHASWQNEAGYTVGTGANGAPVDVLIPRVLGTSLDAYGNVLDFEDERPHDIYVTSGTVAGDKLQAGEAIDRYGDEPNSPWAQRLANNGIVAVYTQGDGPAGAPTKWWARTVDGEDDRMILAIETTVSERDETELYVAYDTTSGIDFRIATYNIYLGMDTVGSLKWDAIEAHVVRVDADIVGLNEVVTADKTTIPTDLATPNGYTSTTFSSDAVARAVMAKWTPTYTEEIESTPPADEFVRSPIYVEFDVGHATKKVGVYLIHTEAWCTSPPCPNAIRPSLEFHRAIEWQRMKEHMDARLIVDPDLEFIVIGDYNDDPLSPQSDSFASEPVNTGWGGFVLGTDITFPVQYSIYPFYQAAQMGMHVINLSTDLDGGRDTLWVDDPNTGITVPVKIDFIAISSGITVRGHEVISSEATQTGGLSKPGPVLDFADSRDASDHKMVIADLRLLGDVAGLSSPCLTYNGTSQKVEFPDHDRYSFGNGSTDNPFSVACWVYFENLTGNHAVVAKDAAIGFREWGLVSVGSEVLWFLKNNGSNDQQAIRVAAPGVQTWHHLAATYDGGGSYTGLKIYIDGVLASVTSFTDGTYTAMANTTSLLTVGSSLGSNFFAGRLSNAVIANKEWSVGEVGSIKDGLTAGLSVIFQAKLIEGSGTVINDSINAAVGTLNIETGAWANTQDVSGV